MTPIRSRVVAIALSTAFASVSGAGPTPFSEDQNESGTISSRRMSDGKQWTTDNLKVETAGSYCYEDTELNCRRYGRLYTWESAQRGCQSAKGAALLDSLISWESGHSLGSKVSSLSSDSSTSELARIRHSEEVNLYSSQPT